jgi:uncharacterized cupredoxin-like copper-binding protein
MRKRTILLMMAILSLAALSLAACSSPTPAGPTEVHVKLSEFKIEMDKTSIPAGPVKFLVENDGTVVHEMVLEDVGAVDKPFDSNGQESEAPDIDPGKSATLDWTLEPGQYQLGCHVPGHYEAGMVTTFTVTAP